MSWVKVVLPMRKGMGYQTDFQMDSFPPQLQVPQASISLYHPRHQAQITDLLAGALVSLCLVPVSSSPSPPPFVPFPLPSLPETLHPV